MKNSGRRLIVIVGLVLVGGLAAVIAATTVSSDATTTTASAVTGPVVIEGESLPRFSAGQDPALGMAAPRLSGTDFRAEAVAAPHDGQATLLLFLAHWCPHCQREVPVLTAWHHEGGSLPGIEIVGVATGNDPFRPNYPPDAWLDREGWPYPVLADDDDSSAGRAYGLSAFPFWVLVDSEGRVVWRASGEISPVDLGVVASAFLP